MKHAAGKSATFTLSPGHYESAMFRRWEIMKHDVPFMGYSIITDVGNPEVGEYRLSMTPIRVFKNKWIRKLQLWFIRYTFSNELK